MGTSFSGAGAAGAIGDTGSVQPPQVPAPGKPETTPATVRETARPAA